MTLSPAQPQPCAAIDIGSHTLLLLVRAPDGTTLHDEASIVGLGRGLGDRGMFRPDAMDSAIEVLARYAARAAELGVPAQDVRAVATSAARRALNATTFLARVHDKTGLQVTVIAGPEEAALTWLGARDGLRLPDGSLAVVDLGGGSTEVVTGRANDLDYRISLEIGAVRTTERFFGASPDRYDPRAFSRLRCAVEAACATLTPVRHPRTVVAVAGTATSLAAMSLGLTAWDRDKVHGSRLRRADLRGWIDRLLTSTPAQRRSWAKTAPSRADYLLAGACILEATLKALQRETLLVSDGGLRHGLLMRG